MEHSQEIAGFVHSFLKAHGVVAKIDDGARLEAQLPVSLADQLGTGQTLRLTFSQFEIGHERATTWGEFITIGHPLLDRMVELAKGRGQAASLLLTAGLNRQLLEEWLVDEPGRNPSARPVNADGHGLLSALERLLSELSFPNASARSLGKRLVYHTQVLFNFKISLVSDEKIERIVSIVIDPVTEEIDRSVDVRKAVTFHLPSEGDPVQEEYRLNRLYRRALSHLEKRLAARVADYQESLNNRMQRELQRIKEYYNGLIQERIEPIRKLFHKMAVASVRADLARSWSTEQRYREAFAALKEESRLLEARYEKELAQLKREKEQRIREMQEKYRARVEVALTHAAFVMVPRVEWRLHLTGRAKRETAILYDLLRRRLVEWECECCGGPLGNQVYLCDCASLSCSECHGECSECGRSLCPSCAKGSCHLCHGPVCPNCTTACPLGLGDSRPLDVCGACRQETCPSCIGLAFFHAEGAGR